MRRVHKCSKILRGDVNMPIIMFLTSSHKRKCEGTKQNQRINDHLCAHVKEYMKAKEKGNVKLVPIADVTEKM